MTGIMDGYEHVVEQLVINGWPSDKSIFEHAAYELLKFHSDHKDEYLGAGKIENPGPSGI
jgi:hypothetical protein